MSKAADIKLIEDAFEALPDMTRGLLDEKRVLYRANLESETRHRRGAPNGYKHGITKDVAAKLFTIREIAEGLESPAKYTAESVLSIRIEYIRAQALANLFSREIRNAWAGAGVDIAAVRALNYAELVKDARA